MPPTLARASIGATVQVLGVRGAPGPLRGRLAELGLREGASIQVVQRTAGGGRIVGIAGTRLALGAEVLDFLAVSEVSS